MLKTQLGFYTLIHTLYYYYIKIKKESKPMKTSIQKNILLEKLLTASHFTSNKLGLSEALRGVLIKGGKKEIHIYSTNLSSYYHTTLPCETEEKLNMVIDTKRVIEFISLLEEGELQFEAVKNTLHLSQKKTTGTFSFINQEDFPLPPTIKEKGQEIKSSFFLSSIPLVLFSSSKDESRPALNGINFVDIDGEMGIVSTDGFRLSLLKIKKEETIHPMLIPSGFLNEVMKFMKGEEKITFSFSPNEKTVLFQVGKDEFFSRLIDGEFPPFERVIPNEKKTTVQVDREELLNKIKLVSIFAREASNIVVCEFSKTGIVLRPKSEKERENLTQLDAVVEGEDQTVAFNFRFVLDFLNNAQEKKIEIELLRPDAPAVFKIAGRKDFIHIIMPVRIQE